MEEEENKQKKTLCHLRITDALDHTVTYMQTHSHPLRNRNLWSKKAVQSEKVLSIHSISVTEVLERPFSSDRTLSRDTLLPSLESNQRSSDLAFTFFPPYLLCSKWWKRRENEGWYHRRRPWKCQAQGIWTALILCGAEPPHHPSRASGSVSTDGAAHNRSVWFSAKPSREALCASVGWAGMNSSAVTLRGKRVVATCWPSTLLQPPEHQDFLTKRWMELSLSGLYENVFVSVC